MKRLHKASLHSGGRGNCHRRPGAKLRSFFCYRTGQRSRVVPRLICESVGCQNTGAVPLGLNRYNLIRVFHPGLQGHERRLSVGCKRPHPIAGSNVVVHLNHGDMVLFRRCHSALHVASGRGHDDALNPFGLHLLHGLPGARLSAPIVEGQQLYRRITHVQTVRGHRRTLSGLQPLRAFSLLTVGDNHPELNRLTKRGKFNI